MPYTKNASNPGLIPEENSLIRGLLYLNHPTLARHVPIHPSISSDTENSRLLEYIVATGRGNLSRRLPEVGLETARLNQLHMHRGICPKSR